MKTIGRMLSAFWRVLNTTRKVVLNLIFLFVFIAVLAAIGSQSEQLGVEDGALMLSLEGRVVEQARYQDPMSQLIKQAFGGQDEEPEVLLHHVIRVIENAKHDRRVKALVIDVGMMLPSGLSKMREIGAAIDDFKEADKPVIATGDWYSQDQYYLASHADTILMNPNGMLLLEGYGRYRLYFKSLLEKLKINTHVFRVGTYKSAVEPFLRDDMSDAAREANQQWLDDLWQLYLTDVSNQRGIDKETLSQNINNVTELLESEQGNLAALSVNVGLIDELADRQTFRTMMADLVGMDENTDTFKQIGFYQYLEVISQNNLPSQDQPLIGIVVAKGSIKNGTRPAGEIGGDSTANLLRQARFNDDIKAVVLRIDSPGGSAFASDLIRAEIDELKRAGKPVVASMSSMAASGGYWIAAPADKIYASPATITGSIGIFGMMATFENTLAHIGVNTDGVGTTPLAGFSPTRPMSKTYQRLIQQNIEHGYRQFLNLVASNRDMTTTEVDAIAQGRVWSGLRAKELGLIDEFGDLSAAVSDAARLAGVENYDTQRVKKPLTEREKFLQALFQTSVELLPSTRQNNLQWLEWINAVQQQVNLDQDLNDPTHTYALCLQCEL